MFLTPVCQKELIETVYRSYLYSRYSLTVSCLCTSSVEPPQDVPIFPLSVSSYNNLSFPPTPNIAPLVISKTQCSLITSGYLSTGFVLEIILMERVLENSSRTVASFREVSLTNKRPKRCFYKAYLALLGQIISYLQWLSISYKVRHCLMKA